MNFFYDGLAIHNLGECSVSQTREYEGGEAPQRCKVTLRLMVDLFEETFADNYALGNQLVAALKNPQGVLRWDDPDTNGTYLNQAVTVARHDLPEDPNGWGTFHQRAVLEFFYYEQNLAPGNLVLRATGSGGPIELKNVTRWEERTEIERAGVMKSERRQAIGRLKVSGQLLADATLDVASRREALFELKAELSALEDKEVAVSFGPGGGTGPTAFNETVRVDDLSVEVDQAVYALAWSFSAHWTKFPDESNYATVDLQVEQRDNNTGELFLTLTGKIAATDEDTARNKLYVMVAAVAAQYGFGSAQELRNDTGVSKLETSGDGEAFIELTFTQELRQWRADNQLATFKRSNAGGTLSDLGNVKTWVLNYEARRFNEQRSQRQHAGGRIEATGTWAGDPAQALATRRTALLAKQAALLAEVNNADGTLKYGAFTQVVRVDNFRAEINQAITGIDWSLGANYSLFPAESGYATVEFSVSQRSSVEDGEETLSFSGRILAPDEKLARAKLGTLRTTMLATYGYGLEQQLKSESGVNGVFANGDRTTGLESNEASDGTTFTELTFSEEYRRRRANLVSWHLKTSTKDDAGSGLVSTSFAGSVIASGATVADAYNAALAQAQALGAGQETVIGGNAFLRMSTISWDKRQTTAGNVEEFVRLEFSYEYQSKSSRITYLEMNVGTVVDAFGIDTTDVSGVIVAADFTTADTLYALVRAPYAGSLLRNERINKGSSGQPQTNLTGITHLQDTRYEFSFQVLRLKSMSRVTYRYGLTVSIDFLTLELSTRVHGSVYAFNAAGASIAVATLVGGLGVGSGASLLRSETSQENEYATESGAQFVKLDFDYAYVKGMAGGLCEMRVTEEVTYSGVRWAVQTTVKNDDGSGGYSVPQDLSVQEGNRTVRGSVTAGDLGTAQAWARKQRALLTGDADGGSFPTPERMETDYEFVPRIDGVVVGTGQNVRLFRVNFVFGEILPNYPTPG